MTAERERENPPTIRVVESTPEEDGIKALRAVSAVLVVIAVAAAVLQAGPPGQWNCRSSDGCIVCGKLYQFEGTICIETHVTCPTYDDWSWDCYT